MEGNFSKDGKGEGWFRDDSRALRLLCTQASLVAQLVKNLPAMQETWVQSLGCEEPLEKGKATDYSILALRIPRTIQTQRVRHDNPL